MKRRFFFLLYHILVAKPAEYKYLDCPLDWRKSTFFYLMACNPSNKLRVIARIHKNPIETLKGIFFRSPGAIKNSREFLISSWLLLRSSCLKSTITMLAKLFSSIVTCYVQYLEQKVMGVIPNLRNWTLLYSSSRVKSCTEWFLALTVRPIVDIVIENKTMTDKVLAPQIPNKIASKTSRT